MKISLFPLLFLSLSCFALSVSHALFHCLSLSLFYSVSPSIQLNLSPLSLSFSSFFLLSFSFYLSLISFLFLSHQSPARSDLFYLSLPYFLSIFFLFSFISLSLSSDSEAHFAALPDFSFQFFEKNGYCFKGNKKSKSILEINSRIRILDNNPARNESSISYLRHAITVAPSMPNFHGHRSQKPDNDFCFFEKRKTANIKSWSQTRCILVRYPEYQARFWQI